MQPPKRQIIKTRPQQPYIVARIILFIIVVVALSLVAWLFLRPRPAHALSAVAVDFTSTVHFMSTGEEAPFDERMAQVQLSVERTRS